MSNAFEPTNPTDSCAYCGRARANLWHRVTSDPGTHAFVEPAPRPSADEAKVREILDRTGWFFEVPRDKAQLVGHDEVLGLLREAYAAGKTDGAREAHEKTAAHLRRVAAFCLPSTRAAIQAQAGVSSALAAGLKMCRHGFVRDIDECGAFCEMTERDIARRGSEG